jgi:hypothetical protein
MNKSDLRVDWATHAAAKHAVENWHYSGSLPMPPLVRVGVWEYGKFVGVVLFGRGANSNLGAAYGLQQTQCVELVRIALTSHAAQVSRVVKIAINFLSKRSPDLRLIVSFADPGAGHHGGVYQAGNWVYAGQTAKKRDFIGPDGKKYLQRQVAVTGYVRQFGKVTNAFKPSQCTPVAVPGKHRYLMPLDAEMRASIMHLSKPYPKRVQQATTDDQSAGRRGGTDPHAPQEAGNGRS